VEEQRPARPGHVFGTYLAAVVFITAMAIPVAALLVELYPDVPPTAPARMLSAIMLGTLVASCCLLVTLLILVRPLEAARFRLLPGWETGATLAVMTLGLLALSQALESATVVLGLSDRGALALIRRTLEQASGPDLFGAVLVLGFGAGIAEEIFFRGYMQARLREHWSGRSAVLAAAVAFALLHVDPSAVHTAVAFALGLYLGFVAEVSGSTLPSIVCHVVNNVVYTLQPALGLVVVGREANLFAVGAGTLVFVACVLWVRRTAPGPAPA
jgi:membrane protease YdiL (CAAX protease family)